MKEFTATDAYTAPEFSLVFRSPADMVLTRMLTWERPMPKLTKRSVEGAVVGTTQAIIWDTDVRGFGLRIMPSGVRSYILNYRNDSGQSRRVTIGKHGSPWTCEDARTKALTLLRGLSTGVDPLAHKAEPKATKTVYDLVQLYLSEGPNEKPSKKLSSWSTDSSNLNRHVLPLIGRVQLRSLSNQIIVRLHADVISGKTAADIKTVKMGRAIIKGGKGTAARTIAVLSAMLAFAVRRGLLDRNVAIGVRVIKGVSYERFLTERELSAIGSAMAAMEADGSLNSVMANAIRLLALTGCRRNEIRSLRWEWVDFDRSYLRLPDSKTGPKVVPLGSSALELLRQLKNSSSYVFPSAKSGAHVVGLQKAWDKVRKRAAMLFDAYATTPGNDPLLGRNLITVRLHDLRHSYASFAVADGATLFMVGKALGHRQTRTTEIYAHLGDDPLRDLANRNGHKISSAMARSF